MRDCHFRCHNHELTSQHAPIDNAYRRLEPDENEMKCRTTAKTDPTTSTTKSPRFNYSYSNEKKHPPEKESGQGTGVIMCVSLE